jgi:hypothetical protein
MGYLYFKPAATCCIMISVVIGLISLVVFGVVFGHPSTKYNIQSHNIYKLFTKDFFLK